MMANNKWKWLFVFIFVTGIFFYPTIFFKKLPIPSDTLIGLYHPWRDLYKDEYPRGVPFKNFLITDPVRQQIPWRKIVIDAWKEGQWPRWNPYTFTGASLAANIQAAPFYPLNILFFLFDFPVAWTVLIILQPIIAGLGMYLYLRSLKLTDVACFVGMIAWAYGGFATSWLTWGTIMHTAAWLPFMLFAIDKNRTKLLVIAMVMTMLAGHAQIALYVILVSIAYLYWRKKFTKNVLFGFAIVGIITSIQWIPFMQSVMESGRVASEGWKQIGWFLPWQHLVQFVVPDFFGNPATLNYWSVWNYGEFIGYLGIIPFVFAFAGLQKSAQKEYKFWITVLGISLLFMIPNPVSYIPTRIPLLSSLQPTRLMVIVDFSFAVMAAIGFHIWQHEKSKLHLWRWYIPGGGMILLWGFVLLNRYGLGEHAEIAIRNLILPSVIFGGSFVIAIMKHRLQKYIYIGQIIPLVFAVIIVFDLFRFGWKYTPFTPVAYFFPTTKIIEFLQNQPKPFRVMSLDDRILPPNVSAYYGIETIEGYDPISPKKYEDFLVASERGVADITRPTGFNRIYTAKNIDSPLLPYLNVRFVLALNDIDRPFLKKIMREGETRVYKYTSNLPRVYLADTTTKVTRQDAVLQTLFSNTAPLPAIHLGGKDTLDIPTTEAEQAMIIDFDPNRIRMRISTKSERLLVILNRYDARAKATVDGKKTNVIPVNYLFTGVFVPTGLHDVILSY